MLNQPLLQNRIHPRLPTRPLGPECCENVRVKPDSDLLLGGILVLATRLSQCADGCRDAATRRDNAMRPVDLAERAPWCGGRFGGSDLRGAKDSQSSLRSASGLHGGTISKDGKVDTPAEKIAAAWHRGRSPISLILFRIRQRRAGGVAPTRCIIRFASANAEYPSKPPRLKLFRVCLHQAIEHARQQAASYVGKGPR